MKRTILVLDEDLLKLATRVLGAKSYSSAVNTALKEVVRAREIQSLPRFFGSGSWEGNLSDMRQDRRPRGWRSRRAG